MGNRFVLPVFRAGEREAWGWRNIVSILSAIAKNLKTFAGRMARAHRVITASALGLALAGCGGGMNMGDLFSDSGAPARQQTQAPKAPPKVGGNAPRVALLLPLSAPGTMGRVARSMKKSAELAMIDAGRPGITLVVKDTSGTPSGARMAAQAAVEEGAKLILGPLLASSVKAARAPAASRGIPVVAFSSQSSVAGNGVYLMSFLPEEEVDNVVRYATSAGKRNIAAMLPQSAYGNVITRAFYAAAKRHHAAIVAEERYVRTKSGIRASAARMAQRLAAPASKADALFFPESPKLLKAAGAAMTAAGFTPARAKLLGTSLWDSAAIRTTPLAIGGWYAGVEPRLVNYFTSHFQQSYGSRPPRIASLAYDATSLAIALGRGAFSRREIENPEGFQGMNGLFRFRSDGRIQRGLAILEVTPTGPRVAAAAPTRFAGGY